MSDVIDQSNLIATQVSSLSLRFAANTNLKIAQAFVPAVSGFIGRWDWSLRKIGTPTGNLFTGIYADSAGSPSATQIGSNSSNLDVSTVPETNPPALYSTNTWSTGRPYVTAGVTYWAILDGDYTINSTDYVQVWRDTTGEYASNSAKLNTSWEIQTEQDFVFREWLVVGAGSRVGKKANTGVSTGTRVGFA